MMAYLISGAVVLMEKSHPGQMKSPVWLDLVVLWTIYFPSAPILSYLSAKMGRCLCSRWRIRIQRDTMTIGVKGILGSLSFYIGVVAASAGASECIALAAKFSALIPAQIGVRWVGNPVQKLVAALRRSICDNLDMACSSASSSVGDPQKSHRYI
jgi:hypothetical protein